MTATILTSKGIAALFPFTSLWYILIYHNRKRLDSEYNLVHCHCLLPAKEVSVQTTEDFVTMSNGSDRKERRFYVCTNRHEEEGCNFVRPTEFVKIGSDGKLHVMDIPDELLEVHAHQRTTVRFSNV